jgi:hypothetical protein
MVRNPAEFNPLSFARGRLTLPKSESEMFAPHLVEGWECVDVYARSLFAARWRVWRPLKHQVSSSISRGLSLRMSKHPPFQDRRIQVTTLAQYRRMQLDSHSPAWLVSMMSTLWR